MKLSADEIRVKAKALLASTGIDEAIGYLRSVLAASHPLQNGLFLIQLRFDKLKTEQLHGTILKEQEAVFTNQITRDIFQLITQIDEETIEGTPRRNGVRKGKLLYHIPHRMSIERDEACFVRVALSKEILLEDLKNDGDDTITGVRIANLMEADLLTKKTEDVFDIELLSEKRQYFLEDDFTEWSFDVTPQRTGDYKLNLKIDVLENVDGAYEKRSKIFRETVSVVSEDLDNSREGKEEDAPVVFKDSGFVFLVPAFEPPAPGKALPLSGAAATTTAVEKSTSLIYTMLITAILAGLAVIFWPRPADTGSKPSLGYFPIPEREAFPEFDTLGTLKVKFIRSRSVRTNLNIGAFSLPTPLSPPSQPEEEATGSLRVELYSEHNPRINWIATDGHFGQLLTQSKLILHYHGKSYELVPNPDGIFGVMVPLVHNDTTIRLEAKADGHEKTEMNAFLQKDSLISLKIGLPLRVDSIHISARWKDKALPGYFNKGYPDGLAVDTLAERGIGWINDTLYYRLGNSRDTFTIYKSADNCFNPVDNARYRLNLSGNSFEKEVDIPYLTSNVIEISPPVRRRKDGTARGKKKARIKISGYEEVLKNKRFWRKLEEDTAFQAKERVQEKKERLVQRGNKTKKRALLNRRIRKDEDGNLSLIFQSARPCDECFLELFNKCIRLRPKRKFLLSDDLLRFDCENEGFVDDVNGYLKINRKPDFLAIPYVLVKEPSLEKYGEAGRSLLLEIGPRPIREKKRLVISEFYCESRVENFE